MSLTQAGLCEGYGGISMAVADVLGAELAWYCEHEPATEKNPNPSNAAARLLAHHHPGIPNHGDLTTVDWSRVQRVDILTAGFPCQDVSLAGRRAGMRPDTRSGLWAHVAYAVSQLRPRLVVIENVRGLLSGRADSDMEPCPWCVGDQSDEPVLRACGRVLGDLADLGFDAEWVGLPASDVGCCHQRFRVFILAWPAVAHPDLLGPQNGHLGQPGGAAAVGGHVDPDPVGVGRRPKGWDDGVRAAGLVAGHAAAGDAEVLGWDGASAAGRGGEPARAAGGSGVAATDASGVGWGEGRPAPTGIVGGPDVAQRGPRPPADPDSGPVRQQPVPHPGCDSAAGPGRDLVASPDPDGDGFPIVGEGPELDARDDADRRGPHCDLVDWGAYGPAIHRWGGVLGRPAPAPTVLGRRGGRQLSPAFVEWLMGLPEGHVDGAPGLTRNEKLKILGNGVVPQQCAHALRLMLPSVLATAARGVAA